MIAGVRILLVCPGKPKRKFVLTAPPFPEVGDPVTYEGVEYRVWNVEPTDALVIPARSLKLANSKEVQAIEEEPQA